MDEDRIIKALEDGVIKAIHSGEVFKIPYDSRIDVSAEMRRAYANIDYEKVHAKITEFMEEELARKIVNKVITEMAGDIKKLMANQTIRDDFRFLMRKGVEDILAKVAEK